MPLQENLKSFDFVDKVKKMTRKLYDGRKDELKGYYKKTLNGHERYGK